MSVSDQLLHMITLKSAKLELCKACDVQNEQTNVFGTAETDFT